MMKEKLLEKFQDVYGDTNGTKVYFAPGRVNLIGEHIDYSGGLVLPCALTLGTYGVARGQENKGLFHEHGGRDSGDCDWRLSSSE